MKNLTEAETAWLAGIYEGEGSCAITSGRAIRVSIVMTDSDVINRICELTGIGSIRVLPIRSKYKQAYCWGVGSREATEFLEIILPWLGTRRSVRAKDAITNWKTNRKQSTKSDTVCVNNHKYTEPGNRRTKYGTCHFCNLESSRKYREKKLQNRVKTA